MKLFPSFYTAVTALESCCGPDSPVAESEVFNETWMLRLTLALLNDLPDLANESSNDPKCITNILCHIQKAVRNKWISEGGLSPVFQKEHTTWADAIVGDIDLQEGNRNVIISSNPKETGVLIIEAKLGSKLAKGTTNAPDYNQAARNIACLAQLVCSYSLKTELFGFIVFTLSAKEKENAINYINSSQEVINKQERIWRCEESKDKIIGKTESIIKKSTAFTWEEIINHLEESYKSNPDFQNLKRFYQRCNSLHKQTLDKVTL